MERVQPSVLARDDTFFGVCEALGEDLRINAQLLRLGFALALFFNPLAAIGGYAAAGLVVAATRWLVPDPKRALPEPAEAVDETVLANDQMELALAA